jgi:Protein of unknown function (DUF1403)
MHELRRIPGGQGMVATLTAALEYTDHHGLGRGIGAWIADAVLAQKLGWPFALPLLGTEASAGGTTRRIRGQEAGGGNLGQEAVGDRVQRLLTVHARAALRAIDLSAELGRRAERLLAIAPKLRARGADDVVERLLSDDAIVASERIAGMSDRGLRRLFDRLVDLSAVRELSGRTAFRIYGL